MREILPETNQHELVPIVPFNPERLIEYAAIRRPLHDVPEPIFPTDHLRLIEYAIFRRPNNLAMRSFRQTLMISIELGHVRDNEALSQEGFFGLEKAANSYNPDQNASFATHSFWQIGRSLSRSVIGGMGIKIPEDALREQFRVEPDERTLPYSVTWLEAACGDALADSDELERYNRHLPLEDVYLEPVYNVADRAAAEDFEAVEELSHETMVAAVDRIFSVLDEKSREVLKHRFGFYGRIKSLQEVGDLLGCSHEWVRKLELHALKLLEAVVEPLNKEPIALDEKISRLGEQVSLYEIEEAEKILYPGFSLDELQAMRRARKLSLAALSELLDIDVQYLSAIECGKYVLRPSHRKKLLKLFGVKKRKT